MNAQRWQFSTRSLLVLTALVSVVLAIAVRMPGIFRIALIVAAPMLFIVALFQSANYATSDRRPRLAAFSWSLMAAFFAAFAFFGFAAAARVGREQASVPTFLGLTMAGCCLVCIHQLVLSFRFMGRNRNRHSEIKDNRGKETST